jgi:hypothetical protein
MFIEEVGVDEFRNDSLSGKLRQFATPYEMSR